MVQPRLPLDVSRRLHSSFTRRLSLFYLFNDIIQYAAKDHNTSYLEHGSNVFIPVVTHHIERFSDKEKSPFLRTLTIWGERHILSKRFVERLRSLWEHHHPKQIDGQTVDDGTDSARHATSFNAKRTIFHGDPKQFDRTTVRERLQNQIISNSHYVSQLKELLTVDDNSFLTCSTSGPPVFDQDPVCALRAGLTAELNV
jgi:hypothetical protein